MSSSLEGLTLDWGHLEKRKQERRKMRDPLNKKEKKLEDMVLAISENGKEILVSNEFFDLVAKQFEDMNHLIETQDESIKHLVEIKTKLELEPQSKKLEQENSSLKGQKEHLEKVTVSLKNEDSLNKKRIKEQKETIADLQSHIGQRAFDQAKLEDRIKELEAKLKKLEAVQVERRVQL